MQSLFHVECLYGPCFVTAGHETDVTVSDAGWRLLRQEQGLTGAQGRGGGGSFLFPGPAGTF